MSTTEAAYGPITVIHSAAGTTVSDTDRDDHHTRQLLKSRGFRWSRNLGCWYLPRTWHETTRAQRVRELIADLGGNDGGKVRLLERDDPAPSAAEREQRGRERAADRAERMDARAQRAEQEADAAEAKARAISDLIPIGQPLLQDHYSAPAHRRDLERIERNQRRSLEASRKARNAQAAAEHARQTATGQESTVTTGNRIERAEAELRRIDRRLEGAGKAIHGEDEPAKRAERDRLLHRRDEVRDLLAHAREKLAAAGGVQHTKATVSRGDLVKVRHLWLPVIRANQKTVTLPSPSVDADSTATDATPWREVAGHIRAAEATHAQVRTLATSTPGGFPGLRTRLERYAESLEE